MHFEDESNFFNFSYIILLLLPTIHASFYGGRKVRDTCSPRLLDNQPKITNATGISITMQNGIVPQTQGGIGIFRKRRIIRLVGLITVSNVPPRSNAIGVG
jgi:hypothetical protein